MADNIIRINFLSFKCWILNLECLLFTTTQGFYSRHHAMCFSPSSKKYIPSSIKNVHWAESTTLTLQNPGSHYALVKYIMYRASTDETTASLLFLYTATIKIKYLSSRLQELGRATPKSLSSLKIVHTTVLYGISQATPGQGILKPCRSSWSEAKAADALAENPSEV